ncbi:MAG: hypothetical protein C4535_10050 [Comamonadaceae bacterium]|nr:MAG: hypothetical protein C4535_10050 [Comamonadaceae bacterium]
MSSELATSFWNSRFSDFNAVAAFSTEAARVGSALAMAASACASAALQRAASEISPLPIRIASIGTSAWPGCGGARRCAGVTPACSRSAFHWVCQLAASLPLASRA